MQELQSGEGLAAALVFSHDGQRLFGAGQDGLVRVWDLHSGQIIRQLSGHDGTVWTLGISPDGQTLVSAGADQTARLWDADIELTLAAAAGMLQREPPLFTPEEQYLYGVAPAAQARTDPAPGTQAAFAQAQTLPSPSAGE